MKTFLLALSLAGLCAAACRAEDSAAVSTASVTVEGIDISGLFTSARGGVFISAQGMTLTSLYEPLASYHSADGTELVNMDIGVLMNTGDAKGSPLAMLGLRLDGLLAKAVSGDWSKNHITAASLPPVEFGPAFSWYAPEHLWIYGANLSVKFGK